MRIAAIQSVIVCCMAGLFVVVANGQQPTFSLVVGAVNGDPLPKPVSSIDAEPGDILRVWILLRDWSAPAGQRLLWYQATIDYEGYLSGCAGNVYPVDFQKYTDPSCPDGGIPEMPNPNAFVDVLHEDPDFVFLGLPWGMVVADSLFCDYRFASVLTFADDAPSSNPGVRYYCGTVDLEVSADAAGVFTLGFVEFWTMLGDQDNEDIPLSFESLTITLPGGEPNPVSSYPPDGAIDARQPSELECSGSGWDAIDITFDCDASEVQASDFTVTVDPYDTDPPVIIAVEPDGDTATLWFDGSIPTGHWTVITHNPTGWSTRMGYLPADVNGDRTSAPLDILSLIDFLNGVGPALEIWQTDIDRSGETNPADILYEIDLLLSWHCDWQGKGPWNGATLPE